MAFCLLWPVMVTSVPYMWSYDSFRWDLVELSPFLSFFALIGLVVFIISKIVFSKEKQRLSISLAIITLTMISIWQYDKFLGHTDTPSGPRLVETILVNERQYHFTEGSFLGGLYFRVYRCEFSNNFCPLLDSKSFEESEYRSLMDFMYDSYDVHLQVEQTTGKVNITYHGQPIFTFDKLAPPE